MMRSGMMVLVVALGCGGGGSSEETASGGGDDATSGGETAAFDGPIQSTDTAAGQAKFDAICGTCHPGGASDIGPAIQNLGWTPGRMRAQVRNGSGQMRPISPERLSDADLEAVLAYVQTFGAVAAN